MPDHKIDIAYLELTRHLSQLQGKILSQVFYHDSVDDDGIPIFEYDKNPDRDELMFGVDLVTDDGTCVGLTWAWIGQHGDYGLFAQPGGCVKMNTGGWPLVEQTKSPQWTPLIGQTICKFSISKAAGLHGKGPYCDCRIDFENGSCVWICARCVNLDLEDPGDDCIVVFSESEAKRIGIRLSES
jgi:hypothetical protein